MFLMKNMFTILIISSFFMKMSWMSFLVSCIIISMLFFFMKNSMKYKKSIVFSNLKSLLNMKTFPFFFSNIISMIFVMIFVSNLCGLLVMEKQVFLSKTSVSLIFLSVSMWSFSYFPFLFSKKEKFTLFVIGEMKFPILSFLLSNIEVLTHIFRPITLTARLWVNIWVGHLIMSSISFLSWFKFNEVSSTLPLGGVSFQFFFFFFELGIMSLQTYVFSYLIKVYFEENFNHSL